MSKIKKSILIVIIFSFFAFEIIGIELFIKDKELSQNSTRTLNGLPVYENSGIMAYNMSNINEAVGAVEYVFIAKINNIDRTEYRNNVEVEENSFGILKKEITDPYTIYNVEVIENIKGDLIIGKNIELTQNGGLNKDQKSYSFFDGGSLLEEGQYYVILAFVPFPNGELLIHNKYTYEKININVNIDNKIDTISYNNLNEIDIVTKYKDAYENEIVPASKIENNLSLYDVSLSN